MTQTLKIFVGSTFIDLELHRAAVRDALHRLEAAVRGMEYFGSLPETPKAECLRTVGSCQIYVGIFAMRYGSIDEDTGKSLTHLEYIEAQRLQLPSLIYLINEDKHAVLPKHVDVGEAANRLSALKSELRRRHVVSFFSSPEDLAVRVSQDVAREAQRAGREVSRGELSKLVDSLPRVDWLTDERFAFLKQRIGELGARAGSDAVLRECLEFLLAGDRLAAVFLIVRRSRLGLREGIDLMIEIEAKVMNIVSDGAKRLATEPGEQTA